MNPGWKNDQRRVNGVGWNVAKDLLAPLITPLTESGHRCILSISVHPSSESPRADRRPDPGGQMRIAPREARKAGSKLNCAVEMGTAVGRSKAYFR